MNQDARCQPELTEEFAQQALKLLESLPMERVARYLSTPLPKHPCSPMGSPGNLGDEVISGFPETQCEGEPTTTETVKRIRLLR